MHIKDTSGTAVSIAELIQELTPAVEKVLKQHTAMPAYLCSFLEPSPLHSVGISSYLTVRRLTVQFHFYR